MRRLLIFLVLVLMCGAVVLGYLFFGSATSFEASEKVLFIRSTAANEKSVMDSLQKNHLLSSPRLFGFLASRFRYWESIKPGRYVIKKGTSLIAILRMLKNGRQTPLNFTINKIRTKEDLAELVGRKFEVDSLTMIQFLKQPDTLNKYHTDSNNVLQNIIPDTYSFYWNASPSAIYKKFYDATQRFWDPEKRGQATQLGLTPFEVYTLASIVEEETTNDREKDTIASVYLNRLNSHRPLQADPTLKFAVRDFSIKWIHGDILQTDSPYNTYKRIGLPPGPICTPSKKTLNAVLHPAHTQYLFFVANAHLNGHLFSETFEEHLKKAAAYHQEDKLRRQRDSLNAAK